MVKDLFHFGLKLLAFALVLCLVHYYVFYHFFSEIDLYFPLWSIYLFNSILVLIVFVIIKYKVSKGDTKTYTTFSVLTMLKMALALVFLIPLFIGKSEHSKVEVINFFLPYFIFLAFEIRMLNKFLKNS